VQSGILSAYEMTIFDIAKQLGQAQPVHHSDFIGKSRWNQCLTVIASVKRKLSRWPSAITVIIAPKPPNIAPLQPHLCPWAMCRPYKLAARREVNRCRRRRRR